MRHIYFCIIIILIILILWYMYYNLHIFIFSYDWSMKAVADMWISSRVVPVGECYTWYASIWEGLRCELALLRDGPLCCRLTCTFLSSAFKLTDPAPTTKRRNVAWRAFRAEFCLFPVNMRISFSLFIPTARNRRKMYSSW